MFVMVVIIVWAERDRDPGCIDTGLMKAVIRGCFKDGAFPGLASVFAFLAPFFPSETPFLASPRVRWAIVGFQKQE